MNLEFIRPKFVGSTIALYIGIFVWLNGFRPIEHAYEMFYIGYTMILGSLAYRSLKKRKLGIIKSSLIRQVFEIVALVVIALPSVLLFFNPARLFSLIANHPETLVALLWAFVAYLDLRGRKIQSVDN